MDTVDFVLQPFGAEEERVLPVHLGRAVDALCCFLVDGVRVAMDRFNAAPPPEAEPGEAS